MWACPWRFEASFLGLSDGQACDQIRLARSGAPRGIQMRMSFFVRT